MDTNFNSDLNSPGYQGYLLKRGEQALSLLRRRFFVLRDHSLYYCADDSLPSLLNPKGCIDLKSISRVESSSTESLIFFLHTPSRVFELHCENQGERELWTSVLNESLALFRLRHHVEHSKKASDSLPKKSTDKRNTSPAASVEASASSLRSLSSSSSSSVTSPSSSSPSPFAVTKLERVLDEAVKINLFTEGFGYSLYRDELIMPFINSIYQTQAGSRSKTPPPPPSSGGGPAEDLHSIALATYCLLSMLSSDASDSVLAGSRLSESLSSLYKQSLTVLSETASVALSRPALFATQCKSIDSTLTIYRRPLCFPPASDSSHFSLTLFDRSTLLAWHALLLRSLGAASSLLGALSGAEFLLVRRSWRFLCEALLGELESMPIAALSKDCWRLFTATDKFLSEPTAREIDANVYLHYLRDGNSVPPPAYKRVGEERQRALERVVSVYVLYGKLLSDCGGEAKSDQETLSALDLAIGKTTELRPYRPELKTIRRTLIKESAKCSLIDSFSLPGAHSASLNASNWRAIHARKLAILKRFAAMIDRNSFPDTRNALLASAAQLQQELEQASLLSLPAFDIGLFKKCLDQHKQ